MRAGNECVGPGEVRTNVYFPSLLPPTECSCSWALARSSTQRVVLLPFLLSSKSRERERKAASPPSPRARQGPYQELERPLWSPEERRAPLSL